MNIELAQEEGKPARLLLAGDLTIAHAASLHGRLSSELGADSSLIIDARGVSFIDASIVQVLMLACHRVRDCHIDGRSAAWDRTLALLGVDLLALRRAPREGSIPIPPANR